MRHFCTYLVMVCPVVCLQYIIGMSGIPRPARVVSDRPVPPFYIRPIDLPYLPPIALKTRGIQTKQTSMQCYMVPRKQRINMAVTGTSDVLRGSRACIVLQCLTGVTQRERNLRVGVPRVQSPNNPSQPRMQHTGLYTTQSKSTREYSRPAGMFPRHS
ncbi:hypothetical protein F4861DRAFT_149471 [Xylaria intraflava]|nr:hypothetical protein F4861DRAFT_149471 [Xylaria intraflava]